MYEFSVVDGFVEISECFGEMIKYLSNEPSVGLYYIQQHVQNAVPNVIHLKNNVTENSRDTILHAEDLEDSIAAVGSMKECGFPIAEEMIGDIKKSLAIMSTKQPVRGLIQPTSSSFWSGSSSSWSPATWNRSAVNIHGNGEKTAGYLSGVFKTAKQKAGNLKWPQLDLRELREIRGAQTSSFPDLLVHVSAEQRTSAQQDEEANKLKLSDHSTDEPEEASDAVVHYKLQKDRAPSGSYSYDSFKADREAKLEEWLEDIGNIDKKRAG